MAIDGKVIAGKNPSLVLNHFDNEERKIINTFSSEWYITNGGSKIQIGRSSFYKFFVMCPTENYKELFNIEREIVVIFSNYELFEARSLNTFDYVCQQFPNLRIEKICFVLISRDSNIEEKVNDLIKREPESQIVIPFHYSELISIKDNYYLRNKFKNNFYNRDLFAFNSPLKKDIYFFGRTDLVHKVVNRHRSNENSGLFGLRKTGKTSLIFAIQRVLKKQGGFSVFIDCQNTSFHMRRWNRALYFIIQEIKKQNKLSIKLSNEELYTETNAATYFEKDIIRIFNKVYQKSIMIIFDEIERITFQVSPTEHWKKGLDFVYFWQALRSLFQKLNNVFSYLVVGTNPKCVETSMIEDQDNPIFSQVPYEYIPPFDVSQTRQMVRKLGNIMGLKFDEIIYSKLVEDFGGHPFMIRIVCSSINEIAKFERPVRVEKTLYNKGKVNFNKSYSNYIEMILTVLKEYFKDEYEMLKFLALDDINSFNEFAILSNEYTNHLLGYNIIDENNNQYCFKIESVKQYLLDSNKYQKINLSVKEIISEVSERRNQLEPKIRTIIRTVLQANYGQRDAKNKVLDIMGGKRKEKYNSLSYKELFNPNTVEIYFDDLRKIILKYWSSFENIFGKDKNKFHSNFDTINKYRIDAHAKKINNEEFMILRLCYSNIEKQVNNFLD